MKLLIFRVALGLILVSMLIAPAALTQAEYSTTIKTNAENAALPVPPHNS